MVRDGLLYAAAFTAGGVLLWWVIAVWYGLPLFLLAAFCLWFFRDPERVIPVGPVAVSPADGKVLAVKPEGDHVTRVTIFLNVFDVHVNRVPVSGVITDVRYQKGLFKVASLEECSAVNEQNIVTVETGDGVRVVFKQIAGLIARRIVCWIKVGDRVTAGDRMGLIKFGSRADVLFGPEWEVTVTPGMRVAGGSSVLAKRR